MLSTPTGNDLCPFAKRGILRAYLTSAPVIPILPERYIYPVWCLLPVLFPEVGVPVILRSVDLYLRGGVGQDVEPAPGPLVLGTNPELADDVRREGKCPEIRDIVRELVLDDAVIGEAVPHFFQSHGNHY